MRRITIAAVALFGACPPVAPAQVISVNLTAPTADRWNYPFANNPGGSNYAAVFGAVTMAGFDPQFDNRDGQLQIAFRTSTLVTTGLEPNRYLVTSAVVTVTVESNNTFAYDPTSDSYRTWLQPNDPLFVADADAGRPVEIFGTAYRYNFDPTVTSPNPESAPYSPVGAFGKGIRTAYPVAFVNGRCVDVSNNVDAQFDPVAFAVGTTALTPGQTVPANTVMQFALDTNNPDVQRFLRRQLRTGVVGLSIASLFLAEQQTTGTYPRFYTKENLAVLAGLVSAARLQMNVTISPAAPPAGDITGNGVVNVDDLLQVINAWGQCNCCAADIDLNGVVNVDDLLQVINTWG